MTGPWADTPRGALLTVIQDADLIGWIELEYGEGFVYANPEDEDDRVTVQVNYNEIRDQYRATWRN